MKITKIKKNKNGGYDLNWLAKVKGDFIKCDLPCNEKPRPEFENALNALIADVVDICEFPTNYGKTIEITGISLSYNEEGVDYGLNISAIKKMQKSIGVMSIVTPYKAKYQEANKKQVAKRKIWDTTDERIKLILKEAKKYLNGVRVADQQEDLFNDNENQKDEKKKK